MVLVSTVRPAAERERRSISGTGSARAAPRMARRVPKAYLRSLSDQKPAGERAVTERTSFSRPSSRASSPPSEFPATCGRSKPTASQKAPSTGTTVDRSYGTPSGSPSEAPKPGRSTATTSRSAASTSSTGSQACQWCPMPWSSSRGSPAPRRSYVRDVVRGPAGVSIVNAIRAGMGPSLPREARSWSFLVNTGHAHLLDVPSVRITAQ